MFGTDMIPTDPRAISRVALEPSDVSVDEQLRVDVLKRAHEEFGYVGESFGARGPLAETLHELSIEPLNEGEVRQYMTSKEREWTVNWRPLVRGLCIVAPMVLTVLEYLIAVQFPKWWAGDGQWEAVATIITMVCTLAFGLIYCNTILFEDIDPINREYKRFWGEFALDLKTCEANASRYSRHVIYTNYIPMFVLSKALSIREKQPTAEFFIHELSVNYKDIPTPEPLSDPFIEVRLGSEHYFFEVWDEKEFERRA